MELFAKTTCNLLHFVGSFWERVPFYRRKPRIPRLYVLQKSPVTCHKLHVASSAFRVESPVMSNSFLNTTK